MKSHEQFGSPEENLIKTEAMDNMRATYQEEIDNLVDEGLPSDHAIAEGEAMVLEQERKGKIKLERIARLKTEIERKIGSLVANNGLEDTTADKPYYYDIGNFLSFEDEAKAAAETLEQALSDHPELEGKTEEAPGKFYIAVWKKPAGN
ncbi:MAG TPA: hypothetical protein VEB60_01910 [Candidatus Paceibacterota bacterium]|nr:hypothetical protein [Candidatus Paceibacterota bacterium]